MNVTMNVTNETYWKSLNCAYVNSLPSSAEQCTFVSLSPSCAYSGLLLNYLKLTYCQLNNQRALALALVLLLLLAMFLVMSLIADEFLCPNLLAISAFARLPDTIAGVTLLAFGNGAPDVFSALSGITQSRPELVFASLFGGGIFDSTVVVATIIALSQSSPLKRPLIRDIAFYLLAASLVFGFIDSGHFTIAFALTTLLFYLIYVLVIAAGRYFYLQKNKSAKLSGDVSDLESHHPDSVTLTYFRRLQSVRILREHHPSSAIQRPRGRDSTLVWHIRSSQDTSKFTTPSDSTQTKTDYRIDLSPDVSPPKFLLTQPSSGLLLAVHRLGFKTRLGTICFPDKPHFTSASNYLLHCARPLVRRLSPIELAHWSTSKWYEKVYSLLVAVPYLFCRLSIPRVDGDWCRMLICLNLLAAPQVSTFLLGVDVSIGKHFPLWLFLLCLSFLSLLVFCLTSKAREPPCYTILFAFLGFLLSLLWLNGLSNEIVALLTTLGVLGHLSDSILGMTLLSWGNCLSDLVADVAMAKAGYPLMGLAAAFSGPMFNLLIGLALPYGVYFAKDGTAQVALSLSRKLILEYTALTISLSISLVIFLIASKVTSKWMVHFHAAILVFIYSSYLAFAFLLEFKVIR